MTLNPVEVNHTLYPPYCKLAFGGILTANPQSPTVPRAVVQDINSVLKVDTAEQSDILVGQTPQNSSQQTVSSTLDGRLKLEMEEFLDLSCFQGPTTPPKKVVVADAFLSDVDELNTPIFDMRNPFNFTSEQRTQPSSVFDYNQKPTIYGTFNNNSVNAKSEYSNMSHLKQSTVATAGQPNTNNSTVTLLEVSQNTEKMINVGNISTLDYKNPSVVSYDSGTNNNSSILFSPNTSENGDYYRSDTMILDFNEEDDIVNMPTVKNFSDIFYTNIEESSNVVASTSEQQTYSLHDTESISNSTSPVYDVPSYQVSPLNTIAMFDTPEESLCGSSISARSTPKLKLNIEAANSLKMSDEVKTSDVINTIEEFEASRDFNILQFINEEDLEIASTALMPGLAQPGTIDEPLNETLLVLPSTSSDIQVVGPATKKTATKRAYKRRNKEEDDEDYVPPSLKKAKGSPGYIKIEVEYPSDESNDSSVYLEKTAKVARRGRPPKRHLSISSEDYSNNPESRYRELRDKNNEASRKSRLKRKIKEQNYEQDAKELEDRNLQLKAKVSELEKMVASFRSNLMTLLLSKK